MAVPRVSAFKPDQLWQQAREPMFWLDQALRVVWVNRAREGLTGHPAESLVGQTCAAYGPTESGEPADVAASFVPPPEAVAGQPSGSLTVILHASGERLWRRIEFWPFRDHGGALIGMLGQVREASTPPSVPDSPAHQLRVRLMELRERLHQAFRCESLRPCSSWANQEPASDWWLEPFTTWGPGVIIRSCRSIARHYPQRSSSANSSIPGSRPSGDDARNSSREPSRGCLSLAEGSSLLIGDILALPRDLQARLAESLDGRVRLIATTAGDPEAALRQEQIRPELYYGLSVLVIRTLPLRERRHDLPLLAQSLLERANQRTGSTCGGFTPRAVAVLQAYDWPGNLSELARVIDVAHDHLRSRARAQAEQAMPLIDMDDLPASIRGHLGAAYLPPAASPSIKPLDETPDRDRAAADRDGPQPGPPEQVVRRRAPGHLPPSPLPPDQGVEPPGRFRAPKRSALPASSSPATS